MPRPGMELAHQSEINAYNVRDTRTHTAVLYKLIAQFTFTACDYLFIYSK